MDIMMLTALLADPQADGTYTFALSLHRHVSCSVCPGCTAFPSWRCRRTDMAGGRP